MRDNAAFFDCIVLFFLAVVCHVLGEIGDIGLLIFAAMCLYVASGWKGLIAWEMEDYGKIQGPRGEGREGPEV